MFTLFAVGVPGRGLREPDPDPLAFDADGKDELILHWAASGLFLAYGDHPTHWWITEGTTSRDQASFTTIGLAK